MQDTTNKLAELSSLQKTIAEAHEATRTGDLAKLKLLLHGKDRIETRGNDTGVQENQTSERNDTVTGQIGTKVGLKCH